MIFSAYRRKRAELRAAQMEENYRAWAAHIGAPPIRLLHDAYWPRREDRVLFHATNLWKSWVKRAVADNILYEWDFKIEDHKPLRDAGITDEETAVEGWHDTRFVYTAQLVLHQWNDLEYFEGDFDFGNAASGLLGMVIHGAEWLVQRLPLLVGKPKLKVNPFKVAKALRRRGIRVRDVRKTGARS